jgi:glycosyltransferase involved in cell wall biosynthesis/GNAT superfamily N-acetyltransferase
VRIAWVTPFSSRSAIAEFSAHVAQALVAHADVELWVSDDEQERLRETELPFHRLGEDGHWLDGYDLAIYNVGDHLAYHGRIYEASQRRAGVVVLHDRVLHNLFAGYWLGRQEQHRYVERMDVFYGAEGRRAAESAMWGLRPPIWEVPEDMIRFPLAEEALVGAEGVVVHSATHAKEVRGTWLGPVCPLFLPAYARDLEREPGEHRPSPPLTVLTVGHVNPNKRIHEVLAVLAADPQLAGSIRYEVAGPPDPRGSYLRELERFAHENGLSRSVSVRGFVSDEELAALLKSADVFVNLRYPSMESASRSLVEELAHGRPVIVYDTGGFGDLSDDAVVKVPPLDRDALATALARLVDDFEARASTGRAGRVLIETMTTDRYAAELLAFLEDVGAARPVLALVDGVSSELEAMQVDRSLDAADRVAEEIAAMFGDELASIADGEALVLRELGPHDLGPLTRFLNRNDRPEVTRTFDPFAMSSETARQIALAPRRDRYYGAFSRGELLALSMLRGWDEGYDVPSFGIAVDVAARRAGVGRRLTDHTIEQARALGSEAVRLSVYASNAVAHGMYERLGFRELERTSVQRRDGAPDERIVMLKELAADEVRSPVDA